MARKSQRLSAGTPATISSAHKRVASNTSLPGTDHKKSKTKKATPTKSQYFSKDANGGPSSKIDSDPNQDATEDDEDFSSAPEDDLSAYGSASDSENADDDVDDNDEEYESEIEEPKSRRKSTSKKSGTAATTKSSGGGELWREGVKTGFGPGQQVIIKKPKARPAGKVPYSDDTIHPNTLLFLKDLKGNNNREWLKMHDPDFRQSEKDWFSFVEKLTERLAEIDDTVPELPVKDIIFRIYRDVRFSKDPTPYKSGAVARQSARERIGHRLAPPRSYRLAAVAACRTHEAVHYSHTYYLLPLTHAPSQPFFSAAWSRTGRKGPYAHYYVQVSPDETFVGGGLWHPEAAPTATMRRAIDRHSRQMKDVLLDENLRKEFLKGAPKNDAKVVKAFVAANASNALKTRPKPLREASIIGVGQWTSRNALLGWHLLLAPKACSVTAIAAVGSLQYPVLASLALPPRATGLPGALHVATYERRRPTSNCPTSSRSHRAYAFAYPHGGKTLSTDRSAGMLRNLESGTAKSGTGKAGSNSNDSGPGACPPLTARSFASIRAVDAIQDGYDADHSDIDLLRLRNYTIGRSLSEDEVVGAGGLDRVSELLGFLKPFITYLNSVVMPDEPESESGEDDAEESSSGSEDGESEG
ncbi:hypothetical protein Q7P37_001947 [Cladosporium fusiforme]